MSAPPSIGEWDILVAGGGLAGVGTACAAARRGARVLLVERLELLGGLGTSGGVGNFCYGDDTLPHGQGAVFDDVWAGLAAHDAIGAARGWRTTGGPPFFNHPFDHQVLALVLLALAERDGVDLLFATDVIGAAVDGERVVHAVLHNRSLTQTAAARVFVDATGDGVLARHAGAAALPPDPDHPGSIPPSHMVYLQRVAAPRPMPVSRPAAPGEPPPKYSVWQEPARVGLKLWWPDGAFDTTTGAGYSAAGRAFRRRLPEFVRHFQETAAGRDCVLAHSAAMLGVRDGVRVAGDYVLTADDLRAGRRFSDAVAHGCFPLDSAALRREVLPPYQIPYRSLLVRGLDNLLVSGRCFSATRVALSSARIMATACLMGQATGIAAALAARAGVAPRAIAPTTVRAELLADSHAPDRLAARLNPGP